jgi:hypothetical protein
MAGGEGSSSSSSAETAPVGKCPWIPGEGDVHTALVAVAAVVVYDKLQEYVLAPYVKHVPLVGGALETVRNVLDFKTRN